MKKYIKYAVFIVTVLLIVLLVMIYNVKNNKKPQRKINEVINEEEMSWVKLPTVYVNGCIYAERGLDTQLSVPEGWEYYGAILNNVQSDEFTPEEDLSSNIAKVGSKVYVNKNDLHKIYVEFIIDGKIQYVTFIDDV